MFTANDLGRPWRMRAAFRHWDFQSHPSVLHERGKLHELDVGTHAVETGHPLEQLIGEERFGRASESQM